MSAQGTRGLASTDGMARQRAVVRALADRSRRHPRRPTRVYRRRQLGAVGVLVLLLLASWTALRTVTDDPAPPSTAGELDGQIAAVATTAPPIPPGEAPEQAGTCPQTLAQLGPRAKAAMLVMVGVDGDDTDRITALLNDPERPAGIFVRDGTAALTGGLLAGGPVRDGRPFLVAVDDEGGTVQPLAGVLPHLPSARAQSGHATEDLRTRAEQRAKQLRELGVNTVFGPTVDVGDGPLGSRTYSDNPFVVAEKARAWVDGLGAGGVIPVLKHFPGHGRADGDSHFEAVSTPPLHELRRSDLLPFGAILPYRPAGVMLGHLDVPELTPPGRPTSLSEAAVGLLRGAFEFDGLIVTDDLVAMDAVTDRFGVAEAALLSLQAGADVALLARRTDDDAVIDHIAAAIESNQLPTVRVDAALARLARVTGCA